MVIGLAAFAGASRANTYTFDRITSNSSTNVEQQFSIEVKSNSATQVSVTFSNSGPIQASIADIYFDDDGNFASIDGFTEPAGVSFTILATPAELPAANNATPDFETSLGLSADSANPPPQNGVNVGEYLVVYLTLAGGKTFEDVIADLESGDLRVGLHVQSIAGGTSDSFVNNPPDNTPDPHLVPDAGLTVTMLGAAMLVMAAVRRKLA
ncbi:MAG TPA: hypothetical protein VIH35_00665 [Kiritimatiellia bacterium]